MWFHLYSFIIILVVIGLLPLCVRFTCKDTACCTSCEICCEFCCDTDDTDSLEDIIDDEDTEPLKEEVELQVLFINNHTEMEEDGREEDCVGAATSDDYNVDEYAVSDDDGVGMNDNGQLMLHRVDNVARGSYHFHKVLDVSDKGDVIKE